MNRIALLPLGLLITALAHSDDQAVRCQPGDIGNLDQFAGSVDLAWPYAVAGARWDAAPLFDSGSLYVFDAATGQELFKLVASEPDGAGDALGRSIAIQGTTILSGAEGASINGVSTGAAYVFDAATGAKLAKFGASDGVAGDWFGWSVALDGGVAIVGACGDDDNGSSSGSAYLFDIATGQELFKLLASDGAAGDCFGREVDIQGNVAIVGTEAQNGRAYLFDVSTGQEIAVLAASDGTVGDDFGYTVAIHGNHAVVGASDALTPNGPSGAVYVFDATTGQELAKIVPPAGASDDTFGNAVDLDGNTLAVGAHGTAGGGLVRLFEVGSWRPIADRRPPSSLAQLFGNSVAVEDDKVLIGDVFEGTIFSVLGAMYVMAVPQPIGLSYCGPAVPNSSGLSGLIHATGSTAAANNCVWVSAARLAPGQASLLLTSQTQGSVMPPGSQGNLCLGGAIGRYRDDLQFTGPAGTTTFRLDLTQTPTPGGNVAVQPGETWNFQLWFRDQNPGTTSNLTDGVSILFQ